MRTVMSLCIAAALSLGAWAAAQAPEVDDVDVPPGFKKLDKRPIKVVEPPGPPKDYLPPPEALERPENQSKKFQVRVPYDGPEIFARLLDHAGLTPIESIEGFGVDTPPEKTILIVFGDPKPLEVLEDDFRVGKEVGIGAFLMHGGSLLVATDRPFHFKQIESLGWTNVKTGGGEPINRRSNFQGNPKCPTIEGTDFKEPKHPIFSEVKPPIVTNCPRKIAVGDAPLRTLASLPLDTYDYGVTALHNDTDPPHILSDNTRRALLIGGHGLFMNCMTVRDDIDNRRLALNTINWLKDGKRTHVLFINENKPVTNFKLPLIGPPRMPTPTVNLVNRLIDTVQNSGLVQRLIDRTIGGAAIVRSIVVIATALLLLYAVKKFFQSSWRLEATPAVVGAPPPQASSLVKQQVRELAARQQLGEPAQALARDWLRTYAHIEFTPGQLPAELKFDIRAGALQRRKLAKHIASLWKLATEPSPAKWDSAKFRGLAIFLEELSLATAAGEVVFRASESPNPA